MKLRVLLDRGLGLRPLRRVNRGLFRSTLAGMGILNHQDFRLSGEEHFITRELPRLLGKSRPVIFDVGANQGDYALLVLDAMPQAEVYAFEPHPVTYAALAARLGARARSVELAMSDEPGTLELFDRATKDGSVHASAYREVIEEIHGWSSVPHRVAVSTVDAQVAALGVEYIDLLKIDTEGHELAVVKGAAEVIRSGRVGAVQFEFNEMNVVSRTFLRDFLKLLPDYVFFRLHPNGLLPMGPYRAVTWEIFAFQNVVAVAPSVAGRVSGV